MDDGKPTGHFLFKYPQFILALLILVTLVNTLMQHSVAGHLSFLLFSFPFLSFCLSGHPSLCSSAFKQEVDAVTIFQLCYSSLTYHSGLLLFCVQQWSHSTITPACTWPFTFTVRVCWSVLISMRGSKWLPGLQRVTKQGLHIIYVPQFPHKQLFPILAS